MWSRRFCRCTLAVAALGAIIACSEHFPRALDDETPITGKDASADGSSDGDSGATDGGVDAADAGTDAGPDCFPADKPSLAFVPVTAPEMSAPVEVVLQGTHLYVLEQGGRVLRVNDDGTFSTVIDVSSKAVAGGEAGLLGLAFHPKFTQNGFVYLYYTVPSPIQPPPVGQVFQSALVRYHSDDGGVTLDPDSEKRILTIDQPYSNHNGGTIAFGNDGFLYWGLGDGGSGGDPLGNGQNLNTLLGKMLRIDVDNGDPYSIPPTNPFATGTIGAKPEIYAFGLRNPYRWRFDRPTGDLWAGDVGQGAREEIDKVILGGNYGWNVREGKICYAATTCAASGFIEPIVDHDRSEATTIIGGVVYRGTGIPLLTGKYVYGDFGRQIFYAIPANDPAPTPLVVLHGSGTVLPSSFALDANGEMVITDYSAGRLLRLAPGPVCP